MEKDYAFVDQATADVTYDPTSSRPRSENGESGNLKISNCTEDTTPDDVEQLVFNRDRAESNVQENDNRIFVVTRTGDQPVDELVEDCKRVKLRDVNVVVEKLNSEIKRFGGRYRSPLNRKHNRHIDHLSDFSLRILVPYEYIGALMGRGGCKIKEITQDTGARVDVYRSNGSRQSEAKVEKVVTIFGTAEICSHACKQILEVLLAKAASSETRPEHATSDIYLKILSANNLIGRVIGKNGVHIKKIMEDTQTKIHAFYQKEYGRNYLIHGAENTDRIISIRGSVDGMCSAERFISRKMKAVYDADCRMINSRDDGGRRFYPTNMPQSGLDASCIPPPPNALIRAYYQNLSVRQNRIYKEIL